MSNDATASDFDPYHKWLGIPKHLQPPTYYQLLGVASGETDLEVIEEAAIRQTTHVRAYQVGPHSEVCTRILNEIAVARKALTTPDQKKAYDQRLPKESLPAPAETQYAVTADTAAFRTVGETPRTSAGRRGRDTGARPERKKATFAPQAKSGLSVPLIVAAAGGGSVVIGLIAIVAVALTRRPETPRAAVELRPGPELQAQFEPKPPVVPQPKIVEPAPVPVAPLPMPLPVPLDPGPIPEPAPKKIRIGPPVPPPLPPPIVRPVKKSRFDRPPPIPLDSVAKVVGEWTHKAPSKLYAIQEASLSIRESKGSYVLNLETVGRDQKVSEEDGANVRLENGRVLFELPTPIPRLLADGGAIEIGPDGSITVTYRNSKNGGTTVPMKFVRAP